jgi:predicted metal-binding protein
MDKSQHCPVNELGCLIVCQREVEEFPIVALLSKAPSTYIFLNKT